MIVDPGAIAPLWNGPLTVIVSDADESEDEVSFSKHHGKQKKRKAFSGKEVAIQKSASKSAPKKSTTPKVTVEEVTDESDTEGDVSKGSRRGPTNQTLAHWHTPLPVMQSGVKKWKFRCNYCKSEMCVQRTVEKGAKFTDESPLPYLGNLATHTRTKHHGGKDAKADGPAPRVDDPSRFSEQAKVMKKFIDEGLLNPEHNPTQAGFTKVFAAWLIEDDLAWTTGEGEGLARLFRYMKSRFLLPSDTTVRNKLSAIFVDLYNKIKSEIKRVESGIAVVDDTWTTKQMTYTFAGTIACWIDDDWKLIERVLDFYPIFDKEHEGEYAAKRFAKAMSDLGVLEKLLTLTMDNASTNDVLAAALSTILKNKFDIQWVAGNGYIRCLAHVVNLVAQKVLFALGEADDPDLEDFFKEDAKVNGPFHYDPDKDEVQQEIEAEGVREDEEAVKRAESGEDVCANSEDDDGDDSDNNGQGVFDYKGLSPLKKLRTIVNKICSSPQRRGHFRKIARAVYRDKTAPSGKKICLLMVVCDVRTRWNSTHAMIKRALLQRKAINRFVSERSELEDLLIRNEEWETLESLCSILEVFTEVTLQMSRSGTPTLPWVLPMYEHMRKHLRKCASDDQLSVQLKTAASAGLTKLDKYYFKATECQYNVIATMLHPHLGLSWFKKVDAGRADKAVTLFEHAFKEYKDQEEARRASGQPATAATSSSSTTSSFLEAVSLSATADDDMDDTYLATTDECERFYKAAKTLGKGDINDPLKWWKENNVHFAVIRQMARDFLAIPGTSVSVERLFSSARRLCTESRSPLKADTISSAMLTKSWIKEGLFFFN